MIEEDHVTRRGLLVGLSSLSVVLYPGVLIGYQMRGYQDVYERVQNLRRGAGITCARLHGGWPGMYNKAGYVLGIGGHWPLLAGINSVGRPRRRPFLGSMAHIGCCFMSDIGTALFMVYLNQPIRARTSQLPPVGHSLPVLL